MVVMHISYAINLCNKLRTVDPTVIEHRMHVSSSSYTYLSTLSIRPLLQSPYLSPFATTPGLMAGPDARLSGSVLLPYWSHVPMNPPLAAAWIQPRGSLYLLGAGAGL